MAPLACLLRLRYTRFVCWRTVVLVVAGLAAEGCGEPRDEGCLAWGCCSSTGPRIDWNLSEATPGSYRIEVIARQGSDSVAYRCDLGSACMSEDASANGGAQQDQAGAGGGGPAGPGGVSGESWEVESGGAIAGSVVVSDGFCAPPEGNAPPAEPEWCRADPQRGACYTGPAGISCSSFSSNSTDSVDEFAVRIWRDGELVADAEYVPRYETIECMADCETMRCTVVEPISVSVP